MKEISKEECQNETRKHKENVSKLINIAIIDLLKRSEKHDITKLESPELDIFTKYTPKLSDCTYGSPEYKIFLEEMVPAIKHHYESNRHHIEFHNNNIKNMNLIDIIEMLCDWMSAALRHKDGDINKSIELNQKRFGYSDEFKSVLINTIDYIQKIKKDKNE